MNKLFCQLLICLLLSIPVGPGGTAVAQSPESLIWLLEENRIDEIKAKLPEVMRLYPDSPTVLYLQAILESDGERARALYASIVEKSPVSRFADHALLRLAQYDFARGLYVTAGKKYQQLTRQYPESPYCDDAHFMRIQCLQARGEIDSMAYALEWFLTRYAGSPFAELAIAEINGRGAQWSENVEIRKNEMPAEVEYPFSIQIGAFKSERNAYQLEQAVKDEGYHVEVRRGERNGETFYLVWVGKFTREGEALAFGREFRDKYGLPFRVVRRL